MISIFIENNSDVEIPDCEEIIENAIIATLDTENIDFKDKNIEVNVNIVDSQTIKKINSEYRGIDKTTDVLSFPLDMDYSFPFIILGDIFINAEKIISQAKEYNHSVIRELTYLTVHSVLHLLDYDHIEDEDRLEMREKEKEILRNLRIFKNEK